MRFVCGRVVPTVDMGAASERGFACLNAQSLPSTTRVPTSDSRTAASLADKG